MLRNPYMGLVPPKKWTLLDYYLKWSPTIRLLGKLHPAFDLTHIPYPEEKDLS